MNTQNIVSGRMSGFLVKVATFITLVAVSVLLLCLVPYLHSLGYGGGQASYLTTFFLLSLLTSALLGGLLAKTAQRRRPLLLTAIYSSALLFMLLSFVNSLVYLYLTLAALALVLGPVIPLLPRVKSQVAGNRTYLYSHVWPWGIAGSGLVIFLLVWLGGQFGLPFVFFSLALLMYPVLLAADKLTKANN